MRTNARKKLPALLTAAALGASAFTGLTLTAANADAATAGSTDAACAGAPTSATVTPDTSNVTGSATRYATAGYQSGPYYYELNLTTPGYSVSSVTIEGHEFKVDTQAGNSGTLNLALGGADFGACRNFIVADVNLTNGTTLANQVINVATDTQMNTHYWRVNQPEDVSSSEPAAIGFSVGLDSGMFPSVLVYGSGQNNKTFPSFSSDLTGAAVQVPGQMAGGWVTFRTQTSGFDGNTGAPWTHEGDPISVYVMGENDANVTAETDPNAMATPDTSVIAGTFERKGRDGLSGGAAEGYTHSLHYDPKGLSVASVTITPVHGNTVLSSAKKTYVIDPAASTEAHTVNMSYGPGRFAQTAALVDYTLSDGSVVKNQLYIAAGTGHQNWWKNDLNFVFDTVDNGAGQLHVYLATDTLKGAPVRIELQDGTQLPLTDHISGTTDYTVQLPEQYVGTQVSLQAIACPDNSEVTGPAHCFYGDATARGTSQDGDWVG